MTTEFTAFERIFGRSRTPEVKNQSSLNPNDNNVVIMKKIRTQIETLTKEIDSNIIKVEQHKKKAFELMELNKIEEGKRETKKITSARSTIAKLSKDILVYEERYNRMKSLITDKTKFDIINESNEQMKVLLGEMNITKTEDVILDSRETHNNADELLEYLSDPFENIDTLNKEIDDEWANLVAENNNNKNAIINTNTNNNINNNKIENKVPQKKSRFDDLLEDYGY